MFNCYYNIRLDWDASACCDPGYYIASALRLAATGGLPLYVMLYHFANKPEQSEHESMAVSLFVPFVVG